MILYSSFDLLYLLLALFGWRPSYTEPTQSLKQTCYFARNMTSLVNKGQNMLHKLSHILLARIRAYKYIFIWRANFARISYTNKLRCCVFNKVLLVNHSLIVVTNGYVLVTRIGAQTQYHDFCFPLSSEHTCPLPSSVVRRPSSVVVCWLHRRAAALSTSAHIDVCGTTEDGRRTTDDG